MNTVVVPSNVASDDDKIKSKDVDSSACAIFLEREFKKQRTDRERTHEKNLQSVFQLATEKEVENIQRHEAESREKIRKEQNKADFDKQHPAHTGMGNMAVGEVAGKGKKKHSLLQDLSNIINSLLGLK